MIKDDSFICQGSKINISLEFPPNLNIIFLMRRLRKQTKPKDAEWSLSQSQSLDQEEQMDFELQKSVSRLVGKEKKPAKKTKKQKTTPKEKEGEVYEQSNSEVLQIRDGDQFVRDHVRPDFLRRWDGVSNELELSQEQIDGMSPMFQVYWPIKARNMKAVVFLEFGKMEYFVFQNDALLLSELFKKKLKHWSKFLMCNFWCKEVQTVKRELFDRKIPVLVMKEIDDPEYRAVHGLVRREVQEVITPAIHPQIEIQTAARERLLMALYRKAESFAFVVLDGETNQFLIEQVKEDKYMHEVRRMMNRHRPVELVLPNEEHQEIAQIARQISNPHIVALKLSKLQDDLSSFVKLIEVETRSPLIKRLAKIYVEGGFDNQINRFCAVMALRLVWQYLSELSLKEKIFDQGLFTQGNGDSFRAPFFDSQVYQNLELFRVKLQQDQTYCKPGTLLHYIDHCRTLQGRKLLHRWLDCPPAVLHDVLQRQEAVCELVQNKNALKYHDKMIGYEKLSRKLGDIYHWIQRSSERGKIVLTKNINFEKQYDPKKNPAVVRIRQMIEVVKSLQEYEQFLKDLAACELKSPLLSQNIQLQDIDDLHTMNWEQIEELKGLPALGYVAQAILRVVVYDQVTGTLQPLPGQCEVFDQNKRQFQRIQQGLEEELNKWRLFFDCNKVQYVSIRAKNQIQVPKSFIKKDGKTHPHPDLIFSSEIAGAVRYTTAESSALSMELVQYQEAMAQAYEPFLQRLISQFSRYRGLWDRYVRSSAWVDALMSLAEASRKMGVRCIPQFREKGITIKGAIHPSLSEVMEKVVPNDLKMTEDQRILLLTGPNMGGKSTLLKQTCLLVVLAQLGCYVPALEYSAPIFDQVFCRIGASDRIYEGKSTFYVELQQTKQILNKATENSLVVIDELGRGTSTFDGMAIAEAVLDHLIVAVRPITLFSTHYSQISQRFKDCKEVRLAKMGYEFEDETLIFTYQLDDGVAQKSFANNVVRMVGISEDIMRKAAQKSEEMHHQTKRKKLLREACNLAGVLSLKDHFSRGTGRQKPESVWVKKSTGKASTNGSGSKPSLLNSELFKG